MSAEESIGKSVDALTDTLLNEGFGAFAEAVVSVLQHAIDHLSDADYINDQAKVSRDILAIRAARNAMHQAGLKVESI